MVTRLAGLAVFVLCALTAHAQSVLYGAVGGFAQSSDLYILDPATGAVVQTVGPIGFAVTGLAVDPLSGVLYGTTTFDTATMPGHLITIDKATGAGTIVGDLLAGDAQTADDITFTPDGTLYGWLEPTADRMIRIDKLTGAATALGEPGLITGSHGSGIEALANDFIFLTPAGDFGQLYSVDRTTGQAMFYGWLEGERDWPIEALAYDSANPESSTLLGVRMHPITEDAELVALGGVGVTLIGPTVHGLDAIAFDIAAVIPEPQTYALLLIGLALLGGMRARALVQKN